MKSCGCPFLCYLCRFCDIKLCCSTGNSNTHDAKRPIRWNPGADPNPPFLILGFRCDRLYFYGPCYSIFNTHFWKIWIWKESKTMAPCSFSYDSNNRICLFLLEFFSPTAFCRFHLGRYSTRLYAHVGALFQAKTSFQIKAIVYTEYIAGFQGKQCIYAYPDWLPGRI